MVTSVIFAYIWMAVDSRYIKIMLVILLLSLNLF